MRPWPQVRSPGPRAPGRGEPLQGRRISDTHIRKEAGHPPLPGSSLQSAPLARYFYFITTARIPNAALPGRKRSFALDGTRLRPCARSSSPAGLSGPDSLPHLRGFAHPPPGAMLARGLLGPDLLRIGGFTRGVFERFYARGVYCPQWRKMILLSYRPRGRGTRPAGGAAGGREGGDHEGIGGRRSLAAGRSAPGAWGER
jgi:hypothetical protein